MHMFHMDVDFEAFERVMVEARERQPIRVLSYCVMSRWELWGLHSHRYSVPMGKTNRDPFPSHGQN